MKKHSTSFKETIKKMGREIDSIITFDGKALGKNDLNAVTPTFQGDLLKSVMKQLEIESNVEIPVGTILNYKFGVKVNDEFEYIDFGNYVVKEIEKEEDTGVYIISCYDKMLYSMVEYKTLKDATFPMTIREYETKLCSDLGLEFKDENKLFANYDKVLSADPYENLGYTYRDIFDELAQVTASTICLDENDKVENREIGSNKNLKEVIINTENDKINDAIKDTIKNFIVEGNSKQDTRSGRNLYNYEDVAWVMNECSTDKDGWITITIDNTSGTDVRYANYYTNSLNIKPSTNYNIILEVKEKTGGGGLAITSVYNGANAPEGQFPNWSLNIPEISNSSVYQQILTSRDISDDAIYGLRTFLAMGAGYSGSITFRISVLEDTTITPETFEYEPYGVSPSPEFPSEIETVGIENYFDTTKIPLETRNGITTTLQEDGGIVFNGTATADTEISYIELVSESKLKVGKEYTFSVDNPLPSGFILFIQNTNDYNWAGAISMINPNVDPNITKETFTIPQLTGTHYKYMALIQSGTVLNNLVIYPKINKGDKQKKFVPYGNYLIVENKTANIFIPSEMTYWSNLAPSWERYGNGIKINTSSTQGGSGVYCSFAQMSNKVDGKTVTFSFSIKSSIDTKLLVGAEYLGKIVDVTTEYKRFSQTLNDFWNYDWYPFVFYNQYANGAEIYVQDIQLEIDDKESPYNECETKTIIYNLQGNELVAIGNVKDELDIVTGTLTKRNDKVILDGSRVWHTWGVNNYTEGLTGFYCFDFPKIGYNRTLISSHFQRRIDAWGGNKEGFEITASGSYYVMCTLKNSLLEDVSTNEKAVESFKKWLSNNNVSIYYQLDEYYNVQLDATEIKTFEGTNHITLESGLETDIKINYSLEYETIDEEYLKDINVRFGEKYGPINSIVLSRSGESDSIYLQDEQSVAENGLCEIKIIDNQIMNFNNRDIYLPDILKKLNGIEFYLNDFSSPGICYLDVCDKYNVSIDGKKYNCIMFNDEINVTKGLEENIYTEMPEQSETDYTKTDKTDRKINQAYIIVDKQNNEITSAVSKVDDSEQRLNNLDTNVTDLKTNLNTLKTTIETIESTILQQTENQFNMWFSNTGLQETLDAVKKGLQDVDKDTTLILEYISFEGAKITLGKTTSQCKVVITNERISFMTGDNESAFIDNNQLYINDSTILNKLQIGKWEEKPDALGNLNTRWIG